MIVAVIVGNLVAAIAQIDGLDILQIRQVVARMQNIVGPGRAMNDVIAATATNEGLYLFGIASQRERAATRCAADRNGARANDLGATGQDGGSGRGNQFGGGNDGFGHCRG